MDVFFGAIGETIGSLLVIPILVVMAAALLAIGLTILRKKRRTSDIEPPHRDGTRPQTPRLSQLDAVSGVGFRQRPILNKEERRAFLLVESFLADCAPGYRILAQISLGEVLSVVDDGLSRREAERAFLAVNAKRLDLGIVDDGFALVAAIEYHGSGHFQGNARVRDAVKREALRSAGVPLVEIHEGTPIEELALRLSDILENHRVRAPSI
jgi:hypothetical protein